MTRTTSSGRAAPLPPDERREALIQVFLDLARRQGRTPSTSEIAAEAGVAEGTIYRAFPTKEALRDEAVATAFCPAPVHVRVEAIDPSLSLRDRLVEFTRIMQQRFTDVFGLMAALGLTQPPNRGAHLPCYDAGRHLRGVSEGDRPCFPTDDHQPLLDVINDLVAGDADLLALPARDVVHRIRLLTFSGSHPGIADGQVLTPEEIVETVLFGVMVRPEQATGPASGLSISELYEQLGGDAETLRRVAQLDGSHESLTPPQSLTPPGTPASGVGDRAQRHT